MTLPPDLLPPPVRDLPVTAVLGDLVAALDRGAPVVLEAPPGAGKTTCVPLPLLDRPWRGDGRIVVTEPRRLAARAAARRMAHLLGGRVGETVGYTVRDDRKVSPATRIEVVTDGVLLRRIQDDPALSGIAAVLFDEFHERSVQADLALAFTLESHAALREDLRLVVMSATLEGERVAGVLEGPVRLRTEGRRFPVDVRWRPRGLGRVEDAAATVVTEALDVDEGGVLVFLPGAGEIRRTAERLRGAPRDVDVLPLYGALPPAEQDRALAPSPPGRRKVVLATDIAQTSLTVDGVRVVVDAGLDRRPRLHPGTGLTRLETAPASRADAEQRAGRAGRVAPGVCYRLWSTAEHAARPEHPLPAMAQTDLTGVALEVAAWGAQGPDELALLDPPPRAAWAAAVDALVDLGMLDADRRLTDWGRAAARLPVAPRLAHVALRAAQVGRGALGAELAALLEERDPLASPGTVDVAERVRAVRGAGVGAVRAGTLARIRRQAQRLGRALPAASPSGPDTDGAHADDAHADCALADGAHAEGALAEGAHADGAAHAHLAGVEDLDAVGALLLSGFPDRLAAARGRRGRFLLASGRGAEIEAHDPLAASDWLVAADVADRDQAARIFLAAPVSTEEIRAELRHRVERTSVVAWEDGDVVAVRRDQVGALTIAETTEPEPDPDEVLAALLEGVRREGLDLLTWTPAARSLRRRVSVLHDELGEPWPDLSDHRLLADLGTWLAPWLTEARRRADLERVPVHDALAGLVGWEQVGRLDDLAPTHLTVPSGSRIRLDYTPDGPVLAVRVQELFGATTTPRIGGGAIPVTLHLLSPARRPLQVTQDLAGFWTRHWDDVRAEMRGRYPKHHWPDDPVAATPHRGVRP